MSGFMINLLETITEKIIFEKFPQQREVNMKALQEIDDDYLSGINLI